MNEYLAGIRFIKMYSWEKPLSKMIASKCVYVHALGKQSTSKTTGVEN